MSTLANHFVLIWWIRTNHYLYLWSALATLSLTTRGKDGPLLIEWPVIGSAVGWGSISYGLSFILSFLLYKEPWYESIKKRSSRFCKL